jgi:Ankyrin repeats (many copies)
MTKVLLAAMDSALINTQDNLGYTPLHCAVEGQQSVETINLLIEHGADVHARCSLGQTPLFYSYDATLTRLLLQAGADANARNYLCNTVLHNAAAKDLDAGLMCCLLKAGADATAIDAYHGTAADVARTHKHSAPAALLSRAERDQHSTHQLQDAIPPLHLMLDLDPRGWRRSTDMTHRTAVFSELAKMPLFDNQPDRTELLQGVELELYHAAADLAEYCILITAKQRAAAVYDTVRTQVLQRAAAAAAALEVEAVERVSSSPEDGGLQQQGDDNITQQMQVTDMSQHLSHQHAAGRSHALGGVGSADNDAASTQSVPREQQHQQPHQQPQQQQQQQQLVQQQRAVTAALTDEQPAPATLMGAVAVGDNAEHLQCITSSEAAAVDAEQQAVADSDGIDMCADTAVLHDAAATAVIACDESSSPECEQADVDACDTTVSAVPQAAPLAAAVTVAASAVVAAPAAAADVSAVAVGGISSGGVDNTSSSTCACCSVSLQQELQFQAQRAAAAE